MLNAWNSHLLEAALEHIGGPLIVAGRVLRAWSFYDKMNGEGAHWGLRNLCTICGMILTSPYEKPRAPFLHRQHREKRREGRYKLREGYLTVGSSDPFRSSSGLHLCARRGENREVVHNIISLSPCKAGVVLVRTRQFT